MNIHDAVKHSLCNSDLDAEVIEEINDTFKPMGPYGKLFSANYLQTKYYQNVFSLVVSHVYNQLNSDVDLYTNLQVYCRSQKLYFWEQSGSRKGQAQSVAVLRLKKQCSTYSSWIRLTFFCKMRQLTLKYMYT